MPLSSSPRRAMSSDPPRASIGLDRPCMRCPVILMFAVLIAAVFCGAEAYGGEQPADLVVRGGKIVTLDERTPVVEAVAARGGRIAALGAAADINRLIGPHTRVIDVPGKLVIPGFIEGHGHFTSLGQSR